MADINWTLEAERWLRDIYDYIAAENPQAAHRVVEGIYERVQLLQQFPELGHRYDRHPGQHIRILLYGHYRIAYLLKPDSNIDILGVFHGALDIDRYLLLGREG
jgi:plasmid stabilization system protein ParE